MIIYELIEIQNANLLLSELFQKQERLENYLQSRYDDDTIFYLTKFGHAAVDGIQIYLQEKDVN